MSEYTPGIYVKGDSERVAKNAADAVALQFEGYKLKQESAPAEQPVEEQRTEQPEAVAPGKALEVPRPSAPRAPAVDKD